MAIAKIQGIVVYKVINFNFVIEIKTIDYGYNNLKI